MQHQTVSGEIFFECPTCRTIEKLSEKELLITREKIAPPEKIGAGIRMKENVFATYQHKCKKCGYDKTQIIDAGIFYSDEDNLIFLRCGKCGYSERVGDKVS